MESRKIIIKNNILNEGKFIFEKRFKNKGKQGIVGKGKIDGQDVVFKLSQYMNYLIDHEYLVMSSLNDLKEYCPHFCKSYFKSKIKVPMDYKKRDDLSGSPSKKGLMMDILYMEYITSNQKLYNIIKKKNTLPMQCIFSLIKQTILAISIAQKKKNFTHYDLHSCNIMIKKCNKDDVFLYILDKDNYFLVPTYGLYPVIIDFGFSYIKDMINQPCYPSLGHTDIGFNSFQYDPISDMKLFLISMSYELKTFQPCDETYKFRTIVKNIFTSLNVDWDSGWDQYDETSIADELIMCLENCDTEDSETFQNYPHYLIDMISTLFVLPVEKRDVKCIKMAYETMVKEFSKIEKDLSSKNANLYIFKKIIDSARENKVLYKNDRQKAISKFREDVNTALKDITSYYFPKNLSYERLLCSILIMGNCMEGFVYGMTRKLPCNKARKNMEVSCIDEIYGIIDVNIPCEYVFNSNTVVHVFDCDKEEYSLFNMKEEYVNKVDYIFKANAVYQYFLKQT